MGFLHEAYIWEDYLSSSGGIEFFCTLCIYFNVVLCCSHVYDVVDIVIVEWVPSIVITFISFLV